MIKIFTVGVLLSTSIFAKEIIIDLKEQRIYATEKGTVVMEGKVSTGKINHRTPSGVFRITEKKKKHKSSIYPLPSGGASMPYMMRLNGSAIAIHQGFVPNYPASHGCIRVKKDLVKRLYDWVSLGTKVRIKGKADLSKKEKVKIDFQEYDLLMSDYYDESSEVIVEVY